MLLYQLVSVCFSICNVLATELVKFFFYDLALSRNFADWWLVTRFAQVRRLVNGMVGRDAWTMLFDNPWISRSIPGSFSSLTTGNTYRAELLFYAHFVASVTNYSCFIRFSFNLQRNRTFCANLIHIVFVLQILKVCELWVGVLDVFYSVLYYFCFALLWVDLIDRDAARVCFSDCH